MGPEEKELNFVLSTDGYECDLIPYNIGFSNLDDLDDLKAQGTISPTYLTQTPNYANSGYGQWTYFPSPSEFDDSWLSEGLMKEINRVATSDIEIKYLKKENEIYKSMIYNRNNKIKGIYPNEKKRILVVKFNDDSIVKLACHKDDDFDINIGVALAYAYKCFGSKTHFKKVVKELTKEIK